MKKFLAFVFAALIVCAAFSSCGKSKKSSPKKEPTDVESTTASTMKPVEYTGIVVLDKDDYKYIEEISKITEKLKDRLFGGPNHNWTDYRKFALVDMNQDGISEILLESLDEVLVIWYYDGKTGVYGTSFRGMYNVKKDGTFYWNAKAGREYGSRRLLFGDDGCKSVDVTLIRHIEDSEEIEQYINGVQVTDSEMQAHDQHSCSEALEWYELNEENVEKYICAEKFMDNSLFCQCGYSRIIELYKSFYEFSRKNEKAFSLSFDELYEIFGISEDENERDCFHSIYSAVVNASHKGGAYYAGYAEKDMNGDGHPELILLTSNYKILDIYTKLNGKITLVDFAGTMGSIDANGNIYISAVGKGNNWLYSVSRLSVEGKLETYLEYGCHDRNINDMEWEYYIIKNGERSVARKDEIYALEEQYYSFFCNESAVNSELGFVPFFEKFDPSGMK